MPFFFFFLTGCLQQSRLSVSSEKGKLLSLTPLGAMETEREHFLQLRGDQLQSQLTLRGCLNGFQLKTAKNLLVENLKQQTK